MNEGLMIVIGMSIAYLASLSGLIFAWIHYKKRKSPNSSPSSEGGKS